MEGDTLKILVATDNHIGYCEKDSIRGSDSLETFEEILKIAKQEKVDFILQGGDLFHDNKPSRAVLHRTMELLRLYCMGGRPCPLEVRSDQAVNFWHSKFPHVNYEDPDYNVSIPVFAIHGNHDDPAGDGNLSCMDLLCVANLINYFGKPASITRIEVSPILIQKGSTRLALYGLGSCRDERLHRLFRAGKVSFLRPDQDSGSWFNVLVIHQNRAKHGSTNYIPPHFLPSFLDLVIWGHEHDNKILPEFVPTPCEGGAENGEGEGEEERGFYVSQPGSSVATSLCDGELGPKNVGLLYITKDCQFKMDPVPLTTVRPFVMDAVVLSKTGIHPQDEERVMKYLSEKVEQLIDKAHRECPESKKEPLVRLKVDYSGRFTTFSLARFGQKFLKRIANPKSILHWHRKRETTVKKEDEVEDVISKALLNSLDSENVANLMMEQMKNEKLALLSEKNLAEGLTEFVEKEERDAVSNFVKFSIQRSQGFIGTRTAFNNEKEIVDQISRQKTELCKAQEVAAEDARAHMGEARRSGAAAAFAFTTSDHSSAEEDERDSTFGDRMGEATRGRGGSGRGRGRGRRGSGGSEGTSSSRGGRGRGRGRGRGGKAASAKAKLTEPSHPAASPLTFATTTSSSDSDSDGEFMPSPSKKRPPPHPTSATLKRPVPPPTTLSSSSVGSRAGSASSTSFIDVDLTQSDEDEPTINPFSFTPAPVAKRRKR